MFEINSLRTDENLEVQGVWRVIGRDSKTGVESRIKVARSGNKEFNRLLRNKVKANKAVIEQEDDLSFDVQEELAIEVYAATILMDVENISFGGKPIEKYTPALGRELLKIKDFRNKVKSFAEDDDAYRVKPVQEEALGNAS